MTYNFWTKGLTNIVKDLVYNVDSLPLAIYKLARLAKVTKSYYTRSSQKESWIRKKKKEKLDI